MCGDCWSAGMALPATAVAARFAWVGYRDKIPFLRRSGSDPIGRAEPSELGADEPVEVGAGVGPP